MPLNIFAWLRDWWKRYKENKKRYELYARLDRNAEGRWTKKDYIRQSNKIRKMEKTRK